MKEEKNYGRDSYWDQKPGVDEERDPAINQSHSQDPWGANLEEYQDIIEIIIVQKDTNISMIRKYQKEEKTELGSNDGGNLQFLEEGKTVFIY